MSDQEDKNLAPRQPDTEQDWALEPVGKPEEFGLAKDSRPSKKRVWDRQEVFLAAFAECGKPVVAARNCDISYWTHIHWEKKDIFGYKERLNAAHAVYCQAKVEGLIDDRLENPQGNRGSDILLMFKAEAEMPEKYRELRDGQVGSAEPSHTVINIIVPEGYKPKGQVVEGESRVVEGGVRWLPPEEDGQHREDEEGDPG